MQKTVHFLVFSVFSLLTLLLGACTQNKRSPQNYLNEAKDALQKENFGLAKLKIDSIQMMHPAAFKEIQLGFDLMQKVRYAENVRNIRFCDSMLEVSYVELKNKLQHFTYQRDPQYQEFGYYIPKAFPLDRAYSQNGLRAAVSEKGPMYIESVISGAQLKHNKIKVATEGGAFTESLSVISDGLNYQFKTLNNTYEVVRFTDNDDNGVAKFIFTFNDQPITVTFIGNTRSISSKLSDVSKKAVAQSFELSTLINDIEALKYEKGRSEALIRYLLSKQ